MKILRNQISEFSSSILIKSLSVLPQKDRRKMYMVLFVQIFLTTLDLIGVAIVGILGALAVSGVQSQVPGNRVYSILKIFRLSDDSFQYQMAALGALATFVLLMRTVFSLFLVRRTIFFLSNRAAVLTGDLTKKLLSQPLTTINSKPFQETVYTLTTGVPSIMLGIISNAVLMLSDIVLLSIMILALFFVDPILSVSSLVLFGSVGFLLNRFVNVRARNLGISQAFLSVNSNSKIMEVLNSYRESVVRNRRDFYSRYIGSLRFDISKVLAELTFMPNIGKYIIELTLVVGALCISAIQFLLKDAPHAVATLSIFLAAGSRIAPAMLRIQQCSIQFMGNIGNASPAIMLLNDLKDFPIPSSNDHVIDTVHSGFEPKVILNNVSYRYPLASHDALSGISLQIEAGQTIALVGTSGAGKTTLIDVLLGVLPGPLGSVEISGKEPTQAFSIWPGAVAYVPQNIVISNATIKSNVSLGYPDEIVEDSLIWKALEVANLSEYVKSLPSGLQTEAGENGSNLSGGQRQRLGIARALFTNPKLIVLDEATSALDGESEASITEEILKYRGQATIIMIAHRLSTVRNSDKVIYLRDGRIEFIGTFDEVRNSVTDFDTQARLMGL